MNIVKEHGSFNPCPARNKLYPGRKVRFVETVDGSFNEFISGKRNSSSIVGIVMAPLLLMNVF